MLRQDLDGTSSLEGSLVYTHIELTYLLSVLENPSVLENYKKS